MSKATLRSKDQKTVYFRQSKELTKVWPFPLLFHPKSPKRKTNICTHAFQPRTGPIWSNRLRSCYQQLKFVLLPLRITFSTARHRSAFVRRLVQMTIERFTPPTTTMMRTTTAVRSAHRSYTIKWEIDWIVRLPWEKRLCYWLPRNYCQESKHLDVVWYPLDRSPDCAKWLYFRSAHSLMGGGIFRSK